MVDLKRLADGLPLEQSAAALRLSANKAFSPDSFEMEVAAACFGGTRQSDQNGWSPMTLWVAMRQGDVYALCPLLPKKWSPPPTLIASLSVSIVSDFKLAKDDESVSEKRRRALQQQFEWIADIDNQDPLEQSTGAEYDSATMVYSRPDKPGTVPSLQGPFQLESVPDEDDEGGETLLTDIHAIGAKLDSEELFTGEDPEQLLESHPFEHLSLGVVYLLTNAGRVHVLLDVDGVDGQWVGQKEVRETLNRAGQ